MTGVHELWTVHGTVVGVDLASGAVVHGAPGPGFAPLAAWTPEERPGICVLIGPPDGPNPLVLPGDGDRGASIGLNMMQVQDGSWALIQPFSRFFVAAEPGGAMVANRCVADIWERFERRPLAAPDPALLAAVDRHASALPHASSAAAALGALRDGPMPELLPLLRLLPLGELDWLGRGLARDAAAAAGLAALCGADPYARLAFPALFDAARPAIRAIDASLDELAGNGTFGHFVSLGHACATFARRDRAPTRGLCLLTTARNEGLYLLEWIAYHRELGVDGFIVYTNDNDDGSDALLRALAEAGVIVWIANQTRPGISPQYKAYGHAFQLLPDLLDYRWAGVIDLDEFIVLDARYRTIPQFIAAREAERTDSISLCWLMFGPNRQATRADAPVTRRFTTRDPAPNVHVKSLCRPQAFIHAHCHYPIWDDYSEPVMRDADGSLHRRDRTGLSAFAVAPEDGNAWIAHYFAKSAEEFILRRTQRRGDLALSRTPDVAHFTDQFAGAFVAQWGAGQVEDDRAAQCSPALEDGIAQLRALPGVAEAMLGVERAYRERLDAVRGIVANDPRFQTEGTPQHGFAKLLGPADSRTSIG